MRFRNEAFGSSRKTEIRQGREKGPGAARVRRALPAWKEGLRSLWGSDFRGRPLDRHAVEQDSQDQERNQRPPAPVAGPGSEKRSEVEGVVGAAAGEHGLEDARDGAARDQAGGHEETRAGLGRTRG